MRISTRRAGISHPPTTGQATGGGTRSVFTDRVSAFDDYQRSIALLQSIDARPDQARTIHAYANALDAAGRDEESRAQFDAAIAMFDDMGIRPDSVPV